MSYFEQTRSASFILEPIGDNAMNSAMKARMAFTLQWNDWFLSQSGISCGRNLHLLYGRVVTLLGPDLLDHTDPVLEWAGLCTSLGLGFNVQIGVPQAIERFQSFERLLGSRRVGVVLLDARGAAANLDAHSVVQVVENIIRHGVSVILQGPVDYWATAGVLDSPVVNAKNVQLIPGPVAMQSYRASEWRDKYRTSLQGSQAAGRLMTSRMGFQNGLQASPFRRQTADAGHELQSVPSARRLNELELFSPCEARFQLVVMPDGWIYPCIGLAGLRSCSLGHIEQPIEKTAWTGGPVKERLDTLSQEGPRLPLDALEGEYPGLPRICSRHRRRAAELSEF